MLRRLYSSLNTFKPVVFHDGLNLIVADKDQASSKGQTRNGAGKSSLVELINSLLGGSLGKKSLLKTEQLVDHLFGLECVIDGHAIDISRCGESPGVYFGEGAVLDLLPTQTRDERLVIAESDWRHYLGKEVFDLSEKIQLEKDTLTFRSLFNYFARSSGGFESPKKTHSMQSTGQTQMALSYLFRLNWEVAKKFDVVRQQQSVIKALKKASKTGALGSVIGSAGDLRTEIQLKEEQLSDIKAALAEFKVLPEYEQMEARAASLGRELANLSAQDTSDKEWKAQLERAIETEAAPETDKVRRLFDEARLTLPEVVSRRFEEVQEFHASVVKNRKEHLKDELTQLTNRVEGRLDIKKRIDDERSEIMTTLQEHGALKQFTRLQDKAGNLEGEVKLLKEKLAVVADLNSKTSELNITKHRLQRELERDLVDHDENVRAAVRTFADISGHLYEDPGRLVVDPALNGPDFTFSISGEKSKGKSRMQIFCMDMMLMKLWSTERRRPRVLIHDSEMFDGVDERQRASALWLGAQYAEQYGFQYIVTMNSDDLPNTSNYPDFDLSAYRVDLQIDDTPNGGLFGTRF